MGQLVTTASSAAAGTDIASLLSPVGVGVGGAVIATTLVVLLALLEITTAAESQRLRSQQSLLLATISPLLGAFGGIVLYESLVILEFL